LISPNAIFSHPHPKVLRCSERIDSLALPQLQVHLSLVGSFNKRSTNVKHDYVGLTQ
jgi:hypothetical protein